MTHVMIPKTIKQTTVADDQGYETPPYSRPRRNIIVPPTIVMVPIQSTALRPARRGVVGVSMSRKKKRIMKARPSKGTGDELAAKRQKTDRHLLTVDVEAPAPADFLREDAPQKRANGAGKTPNPTDHTEIFSTFTLTEEIADADIGEDDKAATSNTLDYSSCNQHLDACA